MCGIAGLMALEGSLDPGLRRALPAMAQTLRHRGPDGDGFYVDAVCGLAHRRLAIIDRAGGKQPLSNEDGTVWITFNGEIYNHKILRERLIGRGHRFSTRSDTEVIVHAYEEYGLSCLDHLEGMFAFAIYNRSQRELLAARDRIGKKPLFYGLLDGVLHFASEIKALAASPSWDPAIDWSELESYLSLGYFLAPKTIYRSVRKLEPGHWLRLANGRVEVKQYWDIEHFDEYSGTETDAIDRTTIHLRQRVAERLESEVPLGAFLSGGIDSGLVVSAMAETHGGAIVTTSVGFGEKAHNELELARLTAGKYRTVHHAHLVQPQLEDILDPLIDAFDEPFADSSAVPTWYLSREARRHVTVALSGDGGDETFGGYDFRYVPHALESRARKVLPGFLRRGLGRAGAAWPRSPRLPRPFRLGTYLENVRRDSAAAYYADLCFLKPPLVHELMGRTPSRDPRSTEVFEAVTGPYNRCSSKDDVQRAQYADLKVYLPNDVLVKVDRMSMQHGLEVRCPLLDRRLVEFAFSLPQRVKRADRSGKHVLKQLAKQRLASELLTHPKHGFTAPVGTWIAGSYKDQFRSEVLSVNSQVCSVIDITVARRLFDEHIAHRADHWYSLWALWILERWLLRQKTRNRTPHLTLGSGGCEG